MALAPLQKLCLACCSEHLQIYCTCIDRNGIFPFINSLHFIIGVGDGTQGGQSTKFGKKNFFGQLLNYVKFGHFIKLCVIKVPLIHLRRLGGACFNEQTSRRHWNRGSGLTSHPPLTSAGFLIGGLLAAGSCRGGLLIGGIMTAYRSF